MIDTTMRPAMPCQAMLCQRDEPTNKGVTIALHEHDKLSGEAPLGFNVSPSLENQDDRAENEVRLRC